MPANPSWTAYPATYRANDMQLLAGWVRMGRSGAVVGPAGVGKSNLLGFLCHRPDALAQYLPTQCHLPLLILVDFNNLPAYDAATLHRLILRSFYETRHQMAEPLLSVVTQSYQESRLSSDPFVSQTAVRELLALCRSEQMQVVLVLDRFDQFCQKATPEMTDSLRGLRDSFKEWLSFIVGMRQEMGYQLADPAALGELYEILDAHVCRLRPLTIPDAQQLIIRRTQDAAVSPDQGVMDALVTLTGGYPSLLKVACQWWVDAPSAPDSPMSTWLDALLAIRPIRHRLQEMWDDLSQEEQLALWEAQKGMSHLFSEKEWQLLNQRQQAGLIRLEEKGILLKDEAGWRIFSQLLGAFVTAVKTHGQGKMWLDESTGQIFQGQLPLQTLSPLEDALLQFLLRHPHMRHRYTELITAVWPAEIHKEGVSTEALFQVVMGLRRKIEPDPTHPNYIINWRGSPEGGYQCFPEGRPVEKK